MNFGNLGGKGCLGWVFLSSTFRTLVCRVQKNMKTFKQVVGEGQDLFGGSLDTSKIIFAFFTEESDYIYKKSNKLALVIFK